MIDYIKKIDYKRKNNLVIVRAGNNSLHKQYFYQYEESRDWDRMIFSYECLDDIDYQHCEFIIKGGLSKWTDFSDLLMNNFFDQYPYEYVWVSDDDILPVEEDALNRLFSYAKKFKLQISQPALSHDSFASWRITYFSPAFHVRYTNFVEVMCPVFSQHALEIIRPDVSVAISGCGLDLIFSELFSQSENSLGIIDDVQVRHTKAVDSIDGAFYQHLRKHNIDPSREIKEFLFKYGLTHKVVTTLGGISVSQTIYA